MATAPGAVPARGDGCRPSLPPAVAARLSAVSRAGATEHHCSSQAPHTAGYIIGRKGHTIRAIAAETGTHLAVDDTTAGAETVHIAGGTRDAVVAAVDRCLAILREAAARPRDEAVFSEAVRVERFQAARVIGRGGEHIRRIIGEGQLRQR